MKIEEKFGWIEFHQEGEEMIIDLVTVNKDCRGSHLGYKLIDKVIDYARKHSDSDGISVVSLCAYPQEEDGIDQSSLMGYYRDYGFDSVDGTEIMEYAI